MDIDFLLFLQGLRDFTAGVLDDLFVQFSVFGEPFYALILMGILYWCISKSMGVFVLMGWGFGRLANGFLKITFCAYRPWIRDARVKPLEAVVAKATGYSFPSGHTTNDTAVFGGPALRRELPRPLRVGLWATPWGGCRAHAACESRLYVAGGTSRQRRGGCHRDCHCGHRAHRVCGDQGVSHGL